MNGCDYSVGGSYLSFCMRDNLSKTKGLRYQKAAMTGNFAKLYLCFLFGC
ncbi:hypothetical protein CK203_003094 [Vitis vinifera]|uniref:Uncharacterized protein n=1 Tax=Vitis vinifera TaxID=29760 RepID=A0A438K7D6_VITVI|nr:hypothetical protein CK203_003094 [Vitis vinifera]